MAVRRPVKHEFIRLRKLLWIAVRRGEKRQNDLTWIDYCGADHRSSCGHTTRTLRWTVKTNEFVHSRAE
ncbi:hypothetical protein ED92_33130 [Amycolatopsis sp. MJM2582]|nr:hypothetical protein ED92_33130 [Amycolatopsis sp. MJM2582]